MAYRNYFVLKTEVIARYVMCHFMSQHFPLYIVTEYPKSGGSWFAQMLSDALDVPFPRNYFPSFTSQVMHGHYPYNPRLNNVFCVIRDGRDVMVSYYYHSLFKNELFNARLVDRTSRYLDFDDKSNIWDNLPLFIEYLFSDKSYPTFNWDQFVSEWTKSQATIIKYEDLLGNAAELLGDAIYKVTGNEVPVERLEIIQTRYSFANLAKRKPGDERPNSFLRKGIAGDWKTKFSPKAREVFDHFAGETLIALGYEQDHSWVRGAARIF